MPITVSETHADSLSLLSLSRDKNSTHLDMENVAAVAQGLTNPRHWVTHTIPKFHEPQYLTWFMVTLLMHRFLTWLQVS